MVKTAFSTSIRRKWEEELEKIPRGKFSCAAFLYFPRRVIKKSAQKSHRPKACSITFCLLHNFSINNFFYSAVRILQTTFERRQFCNSNLFSMFDNILFKQPFIAKPVMLQSQLSFFRSKKKTAGNLNFKFFFFREHQVSYLRSALLASEDIGDFPEGFPTRPRNCTHHVIPFSLFNEDLVRRFPANLYVKRQLITKYGDPSCATAASEASPMPVTTFKGQANQSHPMMSVGIIAEEIPSLLSSTAYRKYGYEKNLLKITSEAIILYVCLHWEPTFKFPALFFKIDSWFCSHHTGYSRNLSQLSRSQSCRSLEQNKKAREIWNWMKTFWARIVIMRRKQESLKLECLSFITGPEAIQSCVISAVRHISNWRRYEDTAKKSMAFWLE